MEREGQTRLSDSRLWKAGCSGGDKKHEKKKRKTHHPFKCNPPLLKSCERLGSFVNIFFQTRGGRVESFADRDNG